MKPHFLEDSMQSEVLEHKAIAEVRVPRKYNVFLMNDDYTPMDFVVAVLKRYFYFSEAGAIQVMLQVHRQGKGLCGVFTRDIAETKVALVNEYARTHEYPLLCVMEPE